MEKRGDLLNQLAIISDLLEKVNMESTGTSVIIELDEENFIKTFQEIQNKYGRRMDKPKDTFTIKIGMIDILFNKNNV